MVKREHFWPWGVLVGASILLVARVAAAEPQNVAQVPNGNLFGCDLCHIPAATTFQELTPFGAQSRAARVDHDVVWGELYDLDADCDGFGNGAELGDPEGNWPDVDAGEATDPNDPEAFPSFGMPEEICAKDGDVAPPPDPMEPDEVGSGDDPPSPTEEADPVGAAEENPEMMDPEQDIRDPAAPRPSDAASGDPLDPTVVGPVGCANRSGAGLGAWCLLAFLAFATRSWRPQFNRSRKRSSSG